MKVLLIHPYISSQKDEFIQTLSEPLGLLYLATYIEVMSDKQIDVEILDLYASGYHKIAERGNGKITRGISDKKEISAHLDRINPDLIGIHCNFTGYAHDAFEIADVCKRTCFSIPITLGGAHASYDSENILKNHPNIDYVVRREGEETFYELINALISEGDISSIRGISFRNKAGEFVANPDRELMKDLSSIPFPDRKFINMDIYKQINSQSFPIAMNHPVATLMASRGCPYNCIFCSTKNMWGRKWRGRPPLHIIQEIQYLVNNYGIREIVFYDDQFLVDKRWVNDICDEIIAKKMDISLSLPAGTSVWLADETLLAKMKKAGFYRLNLPIESGNPDTIKFIGKPIKLDRVLEVIKMANKMGFWTTANFIIGFPDETGEDIKRTIDFAYNCGIDYAFFFIAKPLAGAELYDIMKTKGLLNDSDASSSVFIAKSDTQHFKAEELSRIRNDAEKGFFRHKVIWLLNPFNFVNYFIPKLLSIKRLEYFLKIVVSMARGKHKR